MSLSTNSRLRSFRQCAQHFPRKLKKLFVNNKIILLFFLTQQRSPKTAAPVKVHADVRCAQRRRRHDVTSSHVSNHICHWLFTSRIRTKRPPARLWRNRESRGGPRIRFYSPTSNFAADLFVSLWKLRSGRLRRAKAAIGGDKLHNQRGWNVLSADKMQNHRGGR